MVVRSERTNPIWGWAQPGADVTVSFQGKTQKTQANASGRWRTELAAVPAGGPYSLEVRSEDKTIAFSDVLAGEVWICSGQSNMEWTVAMAGNPKAEIAAGNHPKIRLLNVPRVARAEVQDDVAAVWEICSPETVSCFSAVGYYFGRDIHQKRNVPVGLISSSWGGTVAEAWTEWSFLKDEPTFGDFVKSYEEVIAGTPEEWTRKCQLILDWQKVQRYQDPGNRAWFWGWAEPAADETDWKPFTAPAAWVEPDMHHRGAVWFRKQVTIPADWAGKDLTLSLGALHDNDVTYFNNEKIGGLGKESPDAWMTPRYYRIPAKLIRAGEVNTIASRVFVEFDLGGFTGGGPLALYPEGATPGSGISLAGEWKYRAEYAFDATVPTIVQKLSNGPNFHNSPSNLYNSMIAPLTPYGLSGAIWYQAESNAERAEQYKLLIQKLILCWRKHFENPDLPFLSVLLASYRPVQVSPVEPGWGEIREAQMESLKLPYTGMASAIDVGDANDVHPKDKQSVGHRLALAARALVYGEKLEYSGPAFKTAKPEGNRLRLLFTHTGSGLVTRDGQALKGFAVRGNDDTWLWAEAAIDGDAVVVGHKDLPRIAEVRYAWANNPIGNLANKEGLPAFPFRHTVA